MVTSLADALAAGPFPIVVEIVVSGVKREAQVLEIGSNLANIPEVVAGSIASYPDTKAGQDPLRIGTAVRARGLPPNIHLTCVSRDRVAMRQTLREMRALGLHNVFALTGDRPAGADAAASHDFDSVQLTEMIAHLRAADGTPFHISVAVSPFCYRRDDCLEQYRRLERKVAAGANLAITQAGWDTRKFAELKRYVDDHGLGIRLLGHVHLLTRRTAEQMSSAGAPGGWVPPELVETVRKESDSDDGGLRARLERAARTIAVLKGQGYAGAYISGTHSDEHVGQILHRARELEGDWQRWADELQFGERDGFYLERASASARATRSSRPAPAGVTTTVQPVPFQS
jgi:methylenetetrahydrofolate reductase (NADPH)